MARSCSAVLAELTRLTPHRRVAGLRSAMARRLYLLPNFHRFPFLQLNELLLCCQHGSAAQSWSSVQQLAAPQRDWNARVRALRWGPRSSNWQRCPSPLSISLSNSPLSICYPRLPRLTAARGLRLQASRTRPVRHPTVLSACGWLRSWPGRAAPGRDSRSPYTHVPSR